MKLTLFLLIGIFFCSATRYADQHLVSNSNVIPGVNRSTLVVLLHGYRLDRSSLGCVKATIEATEGYHGSDFLVPDLPFSTFSTAPPSRITAELLQAMDKAWSNSVKEGRPYKRIIIVGHSMGGLYARKIYVAACGENEKAPFDDKLKGELADLCAAPLSETRPWAHAVKRIVLLAGMNRGWTISHHMSITKAVSMTVGSAIGHVLLWVYERPPIIFTIRKGSSFITELRLQWLAMREHARHKGVGVAETVQLLGTVDDLVSPDDNIDLISGSDFTYMEVPQSNHFNVIEMGYDRDRDCIAEGRRKALQNALGHLPDRNKDVGLLDVPFKERKDVTDVVFVIHGIRDEGYWTRKIAYRVRRMGAKLPHVLGLKHPYVVESETSSYGYFPMLSFLRPGARQEKVEWLMDRYTEARARYPNARFHYVGHSNGTYLLAKALQEYPAVKFERVVFAGSVVHRAYEWSTFVTARRVKSVLNFVATRDWVVAFFPKALQSVGIQDLGSAGHDGFNVASPQGPIQELPKHYIVGGHGTALQEAMWDGIAEYVLTGTFKLPQGVKVSEKQSKWVAWPAHVAPLLWVLIFAVLYSGLHFLVKMHVREWQKTLAIIAYLYLIWIVLTKV